MTAAYSFGLGVAPALAWRSDPLPHGTRLACNADGSRYEVVIPFQAGQAPVLLIDALPYKMDKAAAASGSLGYRMLGMVFWQVKGKGPDDARLRLRDGEEMACAPATAPVTPVPEGERYACSVYDPYVELFLPDAPGATPVLSVDFMAYPMARDAEGGEWDYVAALADGTWRISLDPDMEPVVEPPSGGRQACLP